MASAADSRAIFEKQVRQRLDGKLKNKNFNLNVFERDILKKNLSLLFKKYIESDKEKLTQQNVRSLVQNLKIASILRLPISDLFIDKLLEDQIIGLEDVVHTKEFHGPELIPQQYFIFIKEKLGDENQIEYKNDKSVLVTFLGDTVVGFRFSDGTHWGIKPIKR
jgi:hypothetical protein